MSTAITINDIFPRVQYIASSNQAIFSYNFPIFEATDLAVYRTPNGQTPDDDSQRLTLNSDYMVNGVGEEFGGNVTMLITINAGDRITIQRAMPYERLSSYTGGMRFNPDSLDYDLNAIVMMLQQVWTYYEKRFPHYQTTIVDDSSNLRLPVLSNGQFWKRNILGIVAATLEEDPNWSTLRSELANKIVGTDGARLIGYQDAELGGTTVHDAISYYKAKTFYVSDTGTQNSLIANFVPAYTSYEPGMHIFVKVANNNTSAVTINVNGLGVKSVKLQNGSELFPFTLPAVANLIYDGTNFILMNPEQETVGFIIGLNANLTVPANTETPVKFDKIDENNGGYYNPATGEFIIPYNAKLSFSISGQIANSTEYIRLLMSVYVDDVLELEADNSTNVVTGTTCASPQSKDVIVNAGDVVRFTTYQHNASGTSRQLSANMAETFVTCKLVYRVP